MQSFAIPKQIATGLFTDIIKPSIGEDGFGAIWNNTTKKIEWSHLEAYGTASSLIASHIAALNPHSQYALISNLGTAAYTNSSAYDASGAASSAISTHVGLSNPHSQYALSVNLGTAAALNTGTSTGNVVQYTGAGEITIATRIIASVIRPSSDSATAVKITNAAGVDVITIDTTGKNIIVENQVKIGSNRLSIQQHPSYPFQLLFNTFSVFSSAIGVCTTVNGAVALNVAIPAVGSAGMVITGFASGTGNFIDCANSSGVPKFRVEPTGSLVVGQFTTATSFIDVAPSQTDRASLRLRAGNAPTTPNDGDIWFDGTNLKMRISGVTKTFTMT